MNPVRNINPEGFRSKISNGVKTIEPYTPVQYVMGRTKFCGLEMLVDENVLIPRPETEVLVETALEIINERRTANDEWRVLDLCTGSGNIAIALTKNAPDCTIVASDISRDALNVAKRNAVLNGVEDRIEFLNSDLFNNITGKFDIIVSNPPYIARWEFAGLQKEVLKEPRIALDGGEDGLDFYRNITACCIANLNKNGFLIFEIGFGQKKEIVDIINKTGLFKVIEIRKDQNGIDRVIVARWIN